MFDGHIHIIQKENKTDYNGLFFDINKLNIWLKEDVERKALVMPNLIQYCDSYERNRLFFKMVNKSPFKDRIFPFLWMHPDQIYENKLTEFNFYGFKFHPSISQSTLDKNEKLLELCEKYKKPLLIHCGRNEKSRINYVLNMNESYTDVKFICAHLGGLATDLILRALDDIKIAKFKENLYLDTSGCFNPKLIEKAIKILGGKKIIFGSDRPFHDVNVSFYIIKCCKVNNNIKNDILEYNLTSLLNS